MVCGAALNYKWKQKGLSSASSHERDSDSLAQAGHSHKTGGDTHPHDLVHANLSDPDAGLYSRICIFLNEPTKYWLIQSRWTVGLTGALVLLL